MVSQLTFHYCPLYTLINSGVTHYFIARVIVGRLGLKPIIVLQIKIKMLDRDKIQSSQMLIGELVFLRDREMVRDLIVMDMLDFDMILNIDFLSRYKVELDYRKKKKLSSTYTVVSSLPLEKVKFLVC